MDSTSTKKSEIIAILLSLVTIFHKTATRFHSFFISIVLSVFASFFEGISAAIMIPLLNGVIRLNFDFVKENKILSYLFQSVAEHISLSSINIFIILLAIVFFSAILKNIFQYGAYTSFAYFVRKFINGVRGSIFSRYLSFGKLFFDQTSVGYLQTLIIEFPNLISQKIFQTYSAFIQVFMLVVYFLLMTFISLKLTFIIVITAPVLYISVQWLIVRIKKTSSSYAHYYNDISRKIQNILACIPLVKIYSNEKREQEEFKYLNDTVTDLEFSVDKKYVLLLPLQEIIMLLVMLFLVSIMALIVLKGNQKLAEFMVYFYLLKKSVNALGAVNSSVGNIATVAGPISDILKIFDDIGKPFIQEGKEEFAGLKKSIDFKHLSFSYLNDGNTTLEDINFSIEKGKITALVGETGAGKTSLISLILRFYDCPPSTIFIDGVDIRRFTTKSIMDYIALVSQEGLFFNDTIRNNIIYGLKKKVPDKELQEYINKARLSDFIDSLPKGLDTPIGDRGTRLSGGEKQRLAIARVLLKPADIIILDEATNALDSQTEILIQEAISEAIKGKTAIIIAHRLSTIRNADKIVVMENKQLVEEGALKELLAKKGKFYQYWQAQKFF